MFTLQQRHYIIIMCLSGGREPSAAGLVQHSSSGSKVAGGSKETGREGGKQGSLCGRDSKDGGKLSEPDLWSPELEWTVRVKQTENIEGFIFNYSWCCITAADSYMPHHK